MNNKKIGLTAVYIGDLLFHARTDKELTQEEVAEIAEVHPHTVKNVENGANVRLSTLLRIAQALDVLEEIFAYELVKAL